MLKRYAHAPAHLMMDDTPYFLTGAIHGRRPLLADPATKAVLLEIITAAFTRYVMAMWRTSTATPIPASPA